MRQTRLLVLQLVQEALEAGARQSKICQVLHISERTLQRWRQQQGGEDRRKGPTRPPAHKLSEQQRQELVEVANSPEFAPLAVSQIVPILAERGVYLASESTFYRVFRERKQASRRDARKAGSPRKLQAHQADAPGQLWCWDITYLASDVRGRFYYLYLLEDVFSRKIVGWCVEEAESSQRAAQLLQQTCRQEGVMREQVVLHSDNGAAMKGSTMLAMMQRLGVASSFSRPSVSNDNAYVESLFGTMKYRVNYPTEGFACCQDAREWVEGFVQWYNLEHRHSAIHFVTPQQRHLGQDIAILETRKMTYEQAKARHPNRWNTRKTRDWQRTQVVFLNHKTKPNKT